jgi:hypothetical protein
MSGAAQVAQVVRVVPDKFEIAQRINRVCAVIQPSTRRVISSAMLVRDKRTSSANGAFGRHDRQDKAG